MRFMNFVKENRKNKLDQKKNRTEYREYHLLWDNEKSPEEKLLDIVEISSFKIHIVKTTSFVRRLVSQCCNFWIL